MMGSTPRRRRGPTPRKGIYDLYWKFAALRQSAFMRRFAGAPWPWSDDSILQRFKFCNVFRAADRVSQYLIRDIAYRTERDSTEDRLFQIVAFRTFSNPQTWEGVMERLGRAPRLMDLTSGAFERALDDVKRERGGLYTGAFILCATKAFGFDEKHRNHVALFKHMFIEHRADRDILGARSFEAIVRCLERFPLTGPFMSYQTAIDINYSDLVSFSENDYTQAGPGAMRGIAKAFSDLGGFSPSDVIMWMVERQDEEFRRLGLSFDGLWGRQLHAIDCQGLFCELDKYCREAAPELTSNRSRIKARFAPSSDPLTFFFPPKWRINERIGTTGDRRPRQSEDAEPWLFEKFSGDRNGKRRGRPAVRPGPRGKRAGELADDATSVL